MNNKFSIVASVFGEKGKSKDTYEDDYFLNGEAVFEKHFDIKKTFDKGEGIFAVCSGMGPDSFGEIASKEVTRSLKEYLKTVDRYGDAEYLLEKIKSFVTEVNDKVYKITIPYDDMKGRGTTFSSLIIKNDKAYSLNVGDNRVYHFRNKCLKQISVDQTEAEKMRKLGILTKEEAKTHIKRLIVSKFIGQSPFEGKLTAEISAKIDVQENDIFVVCGKSLLNAIGEENLESILSGENSFDIIKKQIIQQLSYKGENENVTLILLQVIDSGKTEYLNDAVIIEKTYNYKSLIVFVTCFSLLLMSYVFTYVFGKIGNYYTDSALNTNAVNTNEISKNTKKAELKAKEAINEKLGTISTSKLSTGLLDNTLTASYNLTSGALTVQQTEVPVIVTPIITIAPTQKPQPTPQPSPIPTPKITIVPTPNTVTNDIISEEWSKVSDVLNNE